MDFDNKQRESKHAFYHLDICCRYVGEKYGHPNISKWTNGDYIKLSGVLSRQTDVQISPNTLKRIFGKLKTTERYYPQKATRDTLARYAGYKNWVAFVDEHPRPEINDKDTEKIPEAVAIIEQTVQPVLTKKKKRWSLVAGISALAILLFIVINNYQGKTNLTGVESVQLICNNPEGTNPHSAVFKLKLPSGFQGDANNFLLNFADGRMPRPINASKLLTHYYEIPGRYYPVLTYNNIPLDTVSVYLKTEGWTATANIQHDSTRVYPLPYQTLFKDHRMQVTTQELYRAGVDTNRTFFVHFVNSMPMEINGDGFELIVDLATSIERPGVRCSQVDICVYGERSMHMVRMMKPGCSSFNGVRFSDNYLDGQFEDLGAMGKDLSKGGNFKLEIKNKQGLVWIDGKQVYRAGYKMPVGKIYGLEISFSGVGWVNSVALRDLRSGKTFQSVF